MLIWLSGDRQRSGGAERELRPRDDGAVLARRLGRAGIRTREGDVREQARALTGWTADWDDDLGSSTSASTAERHDAGSKTVFGKTRPLGLEGLVPPLRRHPAHAGFFVDKLWSYFIPMPPSQRDRSRR